MRILSACAIGLALLISGCNGVGTSQGDGAAVQDKAEAAERDLQQLQGAWQAVDIEHDGGKETPDGGVKWVIRDDHCDIWVGGAKAETDVFTLDPTTQPRRILTTHSASGASGPRLTGIYEVDGDTFRLCYDLTGRDYPSDFTAPRGARRIAYVFRRE